MLRRQFTSLPALFVLSACQAQPHGSQPRLSPELQAQRKRFEGIGLRLIVDAVPDAEMLGVEFFIEEWVRPVFHRARVTRENRSDYDFLHHIPLAVRVIWRKDRSSQLIGWGDGNHYDDYGVSIRLPPGVPPAAPLTEAQEIAKRQIIAKNKGIQHHGPWGSDYDSEMLGDYTVEVARRIPDEVLADIRARRGALRLKFRLKPDGVLFGWDIERADGGLSRYDMAGGDFNAARYTQATGLMPGWEIKPDGSRVETEY